MCAGPSRMSWIDVSQQQSHRSLEAHGLFWECKSLMRLQCHMELGKDESRNIVKTRFRRALISRFRRFFFSSSTCLRSRSAEADSETRILVKMNC